MDPTQPHPIRALFTPHITYRPDIPLETNGPSAVHGARRAPSCVLKHLQNGDVYYQVHHSPSEPAAKSALLDFLNVGISLSELWEVFSASDCRFTELANYLAGARVLRQDPFECLIQFLCSSNNNIARNTKMVDFLSGVGSYLGGVEGFEFHEFPSLERLSMLSEVELRNAGFGYRAKYVTRTVDALQSKRGGGAEWLISLRKLELQEVIDALCTLPGVGPKIATRCLLPELAGARLTPKLCTRVAEAFVSKYGKYAGWAQTLLFVAELPSQKAILPSNSCGIKENNSAKRKEREAGSGS